MKVLLIRNAYSFDFGGAERFPVELAKQISTISPWQVTVVSAQPRLIEYAKSQSVSSYKGVWWSRQNWHGVWALAIPMYVAWQCVLIIWYISLFIRLRPDVIHAQSKDDFIGATIAGRILRKRIVWTDHADLKYIFQNHSIWYKNPVGKLVYWCSRFCHAITLVSNSEKKLIETALRKRLPLKYVVVHNGVDDTKITAIKRSPQEKKAIIFCATSRLVTPKGIGELIRAFIQMQHPRARLWLVGDGPDEVAFKLLANNDERITFWGHQENPLPILAASNAFVHPSYHEGFSLSIVEAAMLSMPIIACAVGGNTEIIQHNHNGLLVQARDVPSLKNAMCELLGNPALRTQLGQEARQTYVAHFDFKKIVETRFLPIYEKD